MRGSSSLALRLGVHPLVAGLTVVAFGTSAPELSVSMAAAFNGRGDIAVGNIVGSNIFNIAVILGIAALIQPLKIHLDLLKKDIPVMIATTVIGAGLLASGSVPRVAGMVLFGLLVTYLVWTVRSAMKGLENKVALPDDVVSEPSKSWKLDVGLVGVGLAILVYGADLFVQGATAVAKGLGVSDAVIGLTVVAAGTSLPELATSVVAACRKQSDIAIGNVVGSNIFNILCILGLTASVSGTIDTSSVGMRDGLVMLGLSLLLLPLCWTGKRISRPEGGVLLLCYGAYMFFLWPK